MNKRKRFFIFFTAAGIMFFFLYFTLSVREDQPLKKWGMWLPENKVISMIMDRYTADGNIVNKNILFSDPAKIAVKNAGLTELEVKHNLRDADVHFFHDKTQARKKPKTYYLTEEINQQEYSVLIEVTETHSYVTEFGKLEE